MEKKRKEKEKKIGVVCTRTCTVYDCHSLSQLLLFSQIRLPNLSKCLPRFVPVSRLCVPKQKILFSLPVLEQKTGGQASFQERQKHLFGEGLCQHALGGTYSIRTISDRWLEYKGPTDLNDISNDESHRSNTDQITASTRIMRDS